MSPNKTSRIAGILYLLMIPLGIIGMIYVPSTLIVEDSITATIANIAGDEMLFRISIISNLLIQLVNILLVLFLFQLLKSVNRRWAVLMVVLILVAAPIAMLNELNHLAVLHVIHNNPPDEQLIALFLDLHKSGIMIAQIFWGLWLFPMGFLVYKSGFLPRIIGILLMIGCFGYLVDSFIYFTDPDFGITFSEFTFIGEVIFPLWLVIKGVKPLDSKDK